MVLKGIPFRDAYLELKSKLRRAKSIPEVNLWAIKFLDDYLNSE